MGRKAKIKSAPIFKAGANLTNFIDQASQDAIDMFILEKLIEIKKANRCDGVEAATEFCAYFELDAETFAKCCGEPVRKWLQKEAVAAKRMFVKEEKTGIFDPDKADKPMKVRRRKSEINQILTNPS